MNIRLRLQNEFLDQQAIDRLLQKHGKCPGSEEFILSVNSCFPFASNDDKVWFIENVFRSSYLKSIDSGLFRRLAAHWRNVANENLAKGKYRLYLWNSITIGWFCILSEHYNSKAITSHNEDFHQRY